MSDRDHDELHDSPLPPADDERIRRLLAEARHTEPMPPSVSARLDAVLADLSSERASREAHDDTRAVVDLAARRRRTVANLLVAAAATVVIGIGIGQVLPHGLGGMGGGANDAATSEQGPAAAPGDSALDSAGGGQEDVPSASGEPDQAGRAFKIRSGQFSQDVRRVQFQVTTLEPASRLLDYSAVGCVSSKGIAPGDDVVRATYNGAPAALVLRMPSGEVQVVDLYLCGDTVPRRSITLTAP